MRIRLSRLIGCFVAAAAVAWLATGDAAAQGPARAAKPAGIARTADGHPDLQGTFNVATITPVDRPAEFGNRLTLTADEAKAMEQYEVQRNEKDRAPSAADRTAPPVGGDKSPTKSYLEGLFRGGGGVVGGYNLIWINPGDRVLTVDGQMRTSIIVDPVDGHVPAMKAEARKRNAAFQARQVSPDAAEGAAGGPSGQYDGPEARPLAERCLLGFSSTSGPPTLPNYFYNNLKQIVQSGNTIMILNEMVHDVRYIRIGGKHPPAYIKKWLGDSIGRWEGDTLVVETTNFRDEGWLDVRGNPLTTTGKMIERFRRPTYGSLEIDVTIDDPKAYTESFTVRVDQRIMLDTELI